MTNYTKKYKNLVLLFLGLSWVGVHYAHAEDESSKLVSEHAKAYRQLIQSGQLNAMVTKAVGQINIDQEPNNDLRTLWSFMASKGLLDDIRQTKYIVSETGCPKGSDPDTAASTDIAEAKSADHPFPNHADVCWDVNKLITERSTMGAVLALAIHEEAHHFGFTETGAYAITQMVGAQLMQLYPQSSDPDATQSKKLLSDVKRGTKFKIIGSLENGFKAMYNGVTHDQLPRDFVGVYCWTDGTLEQGKTFKVVTTVSNFQGNEAPGVLADVSMWLDPYGMLSCQREPEGREQPITIEEFLNAVDGVVKMN
jgi:hypothetical protein